MRHPLTPARFPVAPPSLPPWAAGKRFGIAGGVLPPPIAAQERRPSARKTRAWFSRMRFLPYNEWNIELRERVLMEQTGQRAEGEALETTAQVNEAMIEALKGRAAFYDL